MVQYDLSENAIFLGFQRLFSPWNMLESIENHLRSSDLGLVNEIINLK